MSGIKLYEAVDQLSAILDNVDPETGELPAEYGDIMEVIKAKGGDVAAYYHSQELAAAAAEEHVKAVAARISRIKKQNEWLKSYLGLNMKAAGIKSITGPGGLTVKLLLGRDEAVEIFDERQVSNDFRKPPPKAEDMPISKTAVKAAIKSGVTVLGALLVKRDRVEIKP